MKSYTAVIEEDPKTGDLILPFPDELLTELGWKEGDNLDFEEKNGKIYIKKISINDTD